MANPIGWCDRTWNPVTGCTKLSPGCAHCYAEVFAHRLQAMGQPRYANGFKVTLHEDVLDEPLKWKKPHRIFVCSMADLFHEDVPYPFIDKVFARMMLTPHHTYQILTKRPQRMLAYMTATDRPVVWSDGGIAPRPATTPTTVLRATQDCYERHDLKGDYPWGDDMQWPLPNIWAGTSVESQEYALRLDLLVRVPAAVRFVSAEPLLGPLDLSRHLCWADLDAVPVALRQRGAMAPMALANGVNWVITGCESGPKRRHSDIAWFRDLRDLCKAAGTSYFLKQMEVNGRLEHLPLLDGVQHCERPQP